MWTCWHLHGLHQRLESHSFKLVPWHVTLDAAYPKFEFGKTWKRHAVVTLNLYALIHSDEFKMTRKTWTMIRSALLSDIENGKLSRRDQIPTETELVTRFDAGRHSVRRAIESLAKDGIVSVEQGRGTFVEDAPKLTYSIGKRTRLRKNLLPQGYVVCSESLGSSSIKGNATVCDALGLKEGAMVIRSQRMTFANDLPSPCGTSFRSQERFPDFEERRGIHGSTSKTYKSYGIDDYLRGETSMYARPARPEEAKQLKQHSDLPVMVVRAVDTLLDGTPIAYSRVIWAAGRVNFAMSVEEDA